MKIKFDKTENENLLALIKESTGNDFNAADVEFSGLKAITDTSTFDRANPNKRPIPANTEITLSAVGTSKKFVGSYKLKYRRIDLARQWLVFYGSTTIRYTKDTLDEVSEEKVKQFIKARMNYLTNSVDVAITIDGKKAKAVLTPKTDSLVYAGAVTVNIEEADTRIPLDTLFTKAELDGFEYETEISIPDPTVRGFTYVGP